AITRSFTAIGAADTTPLSRDTVPAGGSCIAFPSAKNALLRYGWYFGCVRMRFQSHPLPMRSEQPLTIAIAPTHPTQARNTRLISPSPSPPIPPLPPLPPYATLRTGALSPRRAHHHFRRRSRRPSCQLQSRSDLPTRVQSRR